MSINLAPEYASADLSNLCSVLIEHWRLPTYLIHAVQTNAPSIGLFEEMRSLLFQKQRVFGLLPWSEFAKEAGAYLTIRDSMPV